MTDISNKAKRAKIVAKVQALLLKTQENGCTEAEALAATEAADRLLAEYDLTYADVEAEVKDDKYGARRRQWTRGKTGTRHHEAAVYCSSAVAKYFNCRVFCDRQNHFVFFGTQEETELAHNLIGLLIVTFESDLARFLKSPQRVDGYGRKVHGKTVRASFAAGFCARVSERLTELRLARNAAQQPQTGRALVVVKDQVVTEKYAQFCRDNGLNLRQATTRSQVRDGNSYRAGQAAGGRVDFGGSRTSTGNLRLTG